MSTGELDAYYERLDAWNRVARRFGYGGGHASLTVHRALADPRAGGRPTHTRIHDIIVAALPAMSAPHVLDAGCGLGGTMLHLAEALDARCVGLTVSRAQSEQANSAAARLGLGDRVHALVRSYDDPPPGPYDLIVAIESLAHSPDPARAVDRLIGTLAPSGALVVVDDMPQAAAASDVDLATFKDGWRLPVLWTADDYRATLTASGLQLYADLDLTSESRPRRLWQIRTLMAVNRVAGLVLGGAGVGDVLRSHRGGLALERLTRRGLVRYRALVARRPGLRVS